MSDFIPTRNVALLIDADNASAATIDPVLTVLAELGSVNVRRVYGNWSKPALNGWRDMTVKHGIEPHQQFDLTKGKNATDMKMTIDAMDLLFRGTIDAFGIMSSDSDFMPLAMRLKQDGALVYGFGTARTPLAFRQACTRFIDVAALVADSRGPADDGAVTPPPLVRPVANVALSPSPAPVAAPAAAAAPAAKKAEVSIEQSLPPSISGAKRGKVAPVDTELLQLLIDAYDSVKRDERGYVSLSALGQLAGNRSSFDARNYGYPRLSDLIKAVPNFQTERREDGRLFVKRTR